jgi:hypothetical protein
MPDDLLLWSYGDRELIPALQTYRQVLDWFAVVGAGQRIKNKP